MPNGAAIGNVALTARPHRINFTASKTIDDAQPIARRSWRRLAAADGAFTKPQFTTSRGVISLHALMTIEHQLPSLARVHHNRRAPAAIVAAACAPNLLAGFFVERDKAGICVGVAVLNDKAIDDDRACSRAPRPFELAEVARPH